VHLCFRVVAEGGSSWIWLVALLAGLSHSWQSAAAEYCRDAYLRFAVGKLCALDLSSDLRTQDKELSWTRNFLEKLLLKFHLDYVRKQEGMCPCFVRLEETARRAFPGDVPRMFRDRYRQWNRGLIRFLNLLRTNTRMLLLFVLLFAGRPAWYFAIELIPLNLLLVVLLVRQNAICRRLQPLVTEHAAN
jgi:hypothetical protein